MYYLGIDFGTSGARAAVIDAAGEAVVEVRCRYDTELSLTDSWRTALWQLLGQLPQPVRRQTEAIAIDGTSGTVLLCDRNNQPVAPPLLYSDASSSEAEIAPADSPARSATSSLAKLLWWRQALPSETLKQVQGLMHQADWLASLLHGHLGISDYNNALKLGYDAAAQAYPGWLSSQDFAPWLPRVVAPGTPLGPVVPQIARQFDLPGRCLVKAGTTDSTAAFLATGANQLGDAVTSLGSTMVLKIVSPGPVNDAASGIYSHRLQQTWLAGGASNTGGAVLSHYFSNRELTQLSQQIDPQRPSHLDYYPLISPGERFPINDPALSPRLSPVPKSRAHFLHGLLESMARIEAQGYQQLTASGSGPPRKIYTVGGGAQNPAWQTIRQRILGLPMASPQYTEAAYGTARLAAGLT